MKKPALAKGLGCELDHFYKIRNLSILPVLQHRLFTVYSIA